VNVAAFAVIAFMLVAYVVLDGYDLGLASITPLVARTDRERAAAMQSIGPFWNGNEVWLIAAGGSLFMLFPQAYAASFSGFYLPFMVVLWLLMFRGIALELRSHFESDLWHTFWDGCFAGSSALLILLFGVALGNLVRGLPLGANGFFRGTFGHLLNPYALLVGLFALVSLSMHGSTFLMMRLEGAPAERGRAMLPRLWWIVLALFVIVSAATYAVRAPAIAAWVAVFPVLSLAALGWLRLEMRRRSDTRTFAASSVFIALLVITAGATMFPYLLPAYPASTGGLSIFEAAPAPLALVSALTVAIAGLCAVLLYAGWVWKKLAGKVRVGE
jgi:cytochrome d ubiquinol oxidase subunit II